jgi:hypothetical protein
MGQSVLVFISHSSDDKESIVEPLVRDLEDCYINVWIDKRKIFPGDNLRKSIFRDGLDKADVALIFFTENSLKSSWVDREIKHVLKDETNKGNNYDLKKIISIFDSEKTYQQINNRYPELTDDLLHLMPNDYSKIDLGQLVSAIWSKYLTLQGGDTETQRQILAKEKEIFQRDKEIQSLKNLINEEKSKNSKSGLFSEFDSYLKSGKINDFISEKDEILKAGWLGIKNVKEAASARAFGLIDLDQNAPGRVYVTEKGRDFFNWYLLNHD